MDSNNDAGQNPFTPDEGNGATSFASDFDMSAINEAIAAGSDETTNIQNSFDVNDIELDNTPTSDADLQKQLNDDPNMSLASSNSAVDIKEIENYKEPTEEPAATFVGGDIMDEEEKPKDDDGSDGTEMLAGIDEVAAADFTNNVAPSTPDETVVTRAPEAAPNKDISLEQASISTPKKKKSKVPTVLLIALGIVAIAAVAVAIVVSLGK
ncbi:MAG: hypothetical protein MJ154_00900 [Candidatus Saccharibacteria bacterium]|nr:hypothetical protein [Candidatus Saccharibacteria bacterium]